MSGWIKLYRSLLEWEWYDDHNATRLLVHLLVSVNHEDKKWKGQTIKAGSLAFSWSTLSDAVGLSVQQLRTAMDRLESSNEVNRQSTSKFQIVTLVKWEKLQDNSKPLTGKQQQIQQPNNRPSTTTKEVKNIENREKEFYDKVGKFASQYPKELLRDFYDYWTEKEKNGKTLRFEGEKYFDVAKRLATWNRRNEKKYPNNSGQTSGRSMMDSLKTE